METVVYRALLDVAGGDSRLLAVVLAVTVVGLVIWRLPTWGLKMADLGLRLVDLLWAIDEYRQMRKRRGRDSNPRSA
jgi:hypothetical protein